MPVSSRVLGVRGDECQCGRRMTVRHCPACGSTRTYARMNRFHEHLDGTVKRVDNEFRCINCGHLFIDAEREFCEAPAVGQKLAQQRVRAVMEAKKQGEYLRPSDERIAQSLAKLQPELVELKDKPPQSEEERQVTLSQLRWDIRREHADKLLAHKLSGKEHPGEVEAYIEARLKELGVQSQEEVK